MEKEEGKRWKKAEEEEGRGGVMPAALVSVLLYELLHHTTMQCRSAVMQFLPE